MFYWVGTMNAIKQQAEEIILKELKELKDNNILERVGANKKGYWKILLDLQ